MKLIDLIICDDIRQEIDGKCSLIGVYSDLVINFVPGMTQFPVNIKIGLFARFKIESGETFPDSFEIEWLHNAASIQKFNGQLALPQDIRYLNLSLVNNAFPIPNIGDLSFKIFFKKNDVVFQVIESDYVLKVVSNVVPAIK